VWDALLNSPHISMDGGDATGLATTIRQKSRVLVSGLTALVERLRHAGHRVVILLPTPRFVGDPEAAKYKTYLDWMLSAWRPDACSSVAALRNVADCGATRLESQVMADQSATVQALTTVTEATHSTTLDLRAQFCSEGVCRTNAGSRWMFLDGFHITVGESEALAPTFAELLRQIALKK